MGSIEAYYRSVIRPCPNVLDCPDPNNPVGNYSSEAFDGLDYLFTFYYAEPPPFLNDWGTIETRGVDDSPVDPIDAALTAFSDATLQWFITNYPGRHLFYNTAQTCCVECAPGQFACYRIAAGLIPGLSQQAADQLAHNVGCNLVRRNDPCNTSGRQPHRFNLRIQLGPIPGYACVGTAYSQAIPFVGGIGPYLWTVTSGTLPDGVSLNPSTGVLSGTPTVDGSFTFTVQIQSQPTGSYTRRAYTICMATIDADFVDGVVGTPYLVTATVSACLPGTVTGQITAGALPAGLSFDGTSGDVFGTPTLAGDSVFEISMFDSATGLLCSKSFSIHVAAAPVTGPDWSTMVWDQTAILLSGGSAAITALGANISGSAAGGAPANTWGRTFLHGSMLYTGGNATCYIHVTVYSYAPNSGLAFSGLQVWQDGVQVFANGGFPVNICPSSGGCVISFPISAGVNSLIEVQGGAHGGGSSDHCFCDAQTNVGSTQWNVIVAVTLSNTP